MGCVGGLFSGLFGLNGWSGGQLGFRVGCSNTLFGWVVPVAGVAGVAPFRAASPDAGARLAEGLARSLAILWEAWLLPVVCLAPRVWAPQNGRARTQLTNYC